jgi:hypothetical protein
MDRHFPGRGEGNETLLPASLAGTRNRQAGAYRTQQPISDKIHTLLFLFYYKTRGRESRQIESKRLPDPGSSRQPRIDGFTNRPSAQIDWLNRMHQHPNRQLNFDVTALPRFFAESQQGSPATGVGTECRDEDAFAG